MLIEFSVGNFRSFDQAQTLSLCAAKENNLRRNIVRRGTTRLLKVVAIYGANASGKSNLIEAIRFMADFVTTSATNMTLGDKINVSPFRHDQRRGRHPSKFQATFLVGQTRFRYGFTTTSERVHDEWLTRFSGQRTEDLFRREYNPRSGRHHWKFSKATKKVGSVVRARTRDNGLALSRGAELNIAPLKPVFSFFRSLYVSDFSYDWGWLVAEIGR